MSGTLKLCKCLWFRTPTMIQVNWVGKETAEVVRRIYLWQFEYPLDKTYPKTWPERFKNGNFDSASEPASESLCLIGSFFLNIISIILTWLTAVLQARELQRSWYQNSVYILSMRRLYLELRFAESLFPNLMHVCLYDSYCWNLTCDRLNSTCATFAVAC